VSTSVQSSLLPQRGLQYPLVCESHGKGNGDDSEHDPTRIDIDCSSDPASSIARLTNLIPEGGVCTDARYCVNNGTPCSRFCVSSFCHPSALVLHTPFSFSLRITC
jgi:hypothetical protein